MLRTANRDVFQRRVLFGQKAYLVRVFVDVSLQPPEVVTAYRTSTLHKCSWEEP